MVRENCPTCSQAVCECGWQPAQPQASIELTIPPREADTIDTLRAQLAEAEMRLDISRKERAAVSKERDEIAGVAEREIKRMQEAFLGEQSAVLEVMRKERDAATARAEGAERELERMKNGK